MAKRLARTLILAGAFALACAPARAEAIRIGVSAPLGDAAAILGEQVRAGADKAAAAAPGTAVIQVIDDECSAEGGAQAARLLLRANVEIVIGYLCTGAIEAALPILKEAGVPAITVGVRADSLTDRRDKTGWPVFRLAPRVDAEAAAAAALLLPRWSGELFAIIDDGTIYGRDLAEGFRAAAEERGLRAVFTDTFRPQLDNQIALAGRLRKAGATHVFAGGDRADLAILGRDAAELGYPLTIAGGEVLRAASDGVELAAGTLMIGLPEWRDIAGPDTLAVIEADGTVAEGYVLPAYAATEIAISAVAGARQSGRPVTEILQEGTFLTAIGDIAFDARGDLARQPYRLYRWDGARFVEAREPGE